MKRLILYFLFLLVSFACNAQNWECVQHGVKRYFTNSNHYLRGIRIDSVKVSGTDTVLYSYRTPRGNYDNNQVLDSNGGSWIGKIIKSTPNGDFIFENYWGDSVIIKSLANLNDSWNFYGNALGVHYEAVVTSLDSATLFGKLDSVKTISIVAKNGATLAPSIPLNNTKIKWSKAHGFIQLVDFYMFPLHEPGKSYQKGFDYFTDIASPYPDTINTTFRLSDFDEPNMLQIYDFNVGDRFMSTTYYGYSPPFPMNLRAIYQKNTVSATEINYLITTWYQGYDAKMKPYTSVSSSPLIVSSQKLFDTLIPEETGTEEFFYYLPDDTTYCTKGLYRKDCNSIFYQNTQIRVKTFEPNVCKRFFKKGLGEIYSYMLWGSGAGAFEEHKDFKLYKINAPCGPYPALNVSPIITNSSVSISPNPVCDDVRIKFNQPGEHYLKMVNQIGQIVRVLNTDKQTETISVGELPNGMYNLRIDDCEGNSSYEKVLVQH